MLRLHFWIQLFTKAIDSTINPYWILKHISSLLKPFNTCISPLATHQESKKGFVKGEALRLPRTNSSKTTFEDNIKKFKSRLLARGYPNNLIEKILSDVKFTERSSALKQKDNTPKQILPFVTQYQPSVPNLKHVLMGKWHLIQNQPLSREIFKEPPLISFKKGKSLNDMLVRAKI